MGTAIGDDARLDVQTSAPDALVQALDLLTGGGAVVLRSAVDFSRLGAFRSAVDVEYADFEQLVAKHGTFGATLHMPAGVRSQPSAAALGLDSIGGWRDVFDAVDRIVFDLAGTLVGPRALLDVDICWLRRQYPDSLRSTGQAPHTLHQDGAYGYDFGASPEGGGPLLPILTAWIPLVAAGGDAPGLELVPTHLSRVLGLHELSDGYADAQWPPSGRVRPVTAPGDVVLMAGHHLHRTYISPAMTLPRTCVELRFVSSRTGGPLAGHQMLDLVGR